MKKLIMDGPAKSKIINVDNPSIGDNQLLVKVTYTGMCHSELYPWLHAKKGTVLGHEAIGVVADKGRNVQNFKIGDRVTGLGGGGYKEYIVMEQDKTCHVPDHLKDEDAIAEPLACLLSAVQKMNIELLGDSIAVVGAGYMGLGMISLFKAMGYGNIVAVDYREEARENALKYGATQVFHPDELPSLYRLDWDNIKEPDLTRDGHKTDIFNIGFKNVMEFTGTQDGLALAGEMASAHGRLGIGGYHNDGSRNIDYQLWNFKALTTINCHERRIEYEAQLCKRCMELLSSGLWKFTGVTRHIYDLEDFDEAQYDMMNHKNGFIKGAVRC